MAAALKAGSLVVPLSRRNLGRVFGLKSESPFDAADRREDQAGKYSRNDRKADFAEARQHTDGAGHPYPGGGRQAFDVCAVSKLDDRTGPDKTDARRDSLNDA